MANVTITQLPAAGPVDGTESVPIVQNGVTVRTTTAAIAGSPSQQQTFITVSQESTLPNSRYLSTGTGLGMTDGGALSFYRLALTGASGSLETAGNGFVVKTGSTTVVPRNIAVSGSGVAISNGDGQSGNPTISLTGSVLNLANAFGNGILTIDVSGGISITQIMGTSNQISVANGTGIGASPTISISDNPIFPGTGGSTIPNGTTAQRSGGYGSIRYNTSLQQFEGNTSTGWNQFSLTGGVTSFSAGTTGFTPSTASTGAVILSGTLNVANGGTGGTATPIAGAVAYGSGTVYSFTAAGISGQVLTSAGAGTPTWTTPTTGTVTSVTGTSPVVSSGGATPAISIPAATTSVSGYLTSTDWNTFNNKGSGSVTAVSVVSANGLAGSSSGGATPALTISTTVTGMVKGNGTALSAASAATDYVAPSAYASANGLTMATARLLGRTTASTGAAEEISVAGGLTLTAGVLTGTSGTVTNVSGTSPVVSSGGTTPAISMPAATTSVSGYLTSTDWTTFNNKGSGSVTTVGFTGGIITVANPTTTPAFTVAGTSGGIPYFTSASTWATSAILAASSLVVGGGAGATPATVTTGTGVVTALGVNTGSAGAFVVNGGALGTPSSGTVTNLTGTASININGTVGATSTNTGYFTTLTASADSSFTSTGALLISKGTTAQQPTPATGMLRYNTTTNQFEGYSGSSPAWNPVGGASVSNDTVTATNVYPLFASSTSGTATTLYTSNANYLYKPSTGELAAKVINASNGLVVNSQTVGTSYTIASGNSAMSAGPMTVSSGVVVTIPSGSRWVII